MAKLNEVSLFWLGQMGLLIKAGNETLCIDYFASNIEGRLVPPPVPAEELKGITAFLGTHDHIDHIDHDAWKIWAKTNPDDKFVFPRMHMESVLSDGVSPRNAIGMNEGETAPSVVIPGHWDMFANNSADPFEFKDYLDAKYGDSILCKIPEIMEGITL